jgi:hypothetical protein
MQIIRLCNYCTVFTSYGQILKYIFQEIESCDSSHVYEETKQLLHNVHMSQFVKWATSNGLLNNN